MRGTKAKAQRREHPDRPNPGRKHGGEDAKQIRLAAAAGSMGRGRQLARQVMRNLAAKKKAASGHR